MSTAHENITTYLKTVTAITDIVGAKIMTPDLEQGTTPPALNFWRVTNTALHVRSIVQPRYQFDCWALDPLNAEKLGDAVKGAIEGYHGLMGSMHVVSLVLTAMGPRQDPVTGHYRTIVDVRLHYDEPAP